MTESELTVLDRGTIRSDARQVVQGYKFGTRSKPNPETVMGEGPLYNVVIDHPEATILWDTGAHPDAADGYWSEDQLDAFEIVDDPPDLRTALDEAGYELGDLDAVIQSHLHMDHAGGLYAFDGTDVPIYVHVDEFEHAYLAAQTDRGDEWYIAEDFHHDLDWEIVSRDAMKLFAGIELVHLPGHTPGLLGVQVETASGTALLISDQADIHLNYEAEIPMSGGMMWSKAHWERSLEEVRARARPDDALVAAGHDEDDVAALEELS
jgi:N-acyl homoserine lactone hydrolase